MNVVRVNCAHGDHKEWARRIETVREAALLERSNVAVLLDLSGPKIRTGDFETETVTLKKGQAFQFTTKKGTGDQHHVWVNYSKFPKEVQSGMEIMLDDGKLIFRVEKVFKDIVYTRVIVGGTIRGRRGVNVPHARLSISTITSKDKKDIEFGIRAGVDLFALSFVRHEKDIMHLRHMLHKSHSRASIVAKIETQGALERLREIIHVSDAVMVARGDLAVEIPKEEVPLAQKQIIRAAGNAGKIVITATQMLDSMTTQSTPTRAEVGDVANAIFDGTDAVMLSQESAMGVDPVHVVKTMASIAERTEQSALYHNSVHRFSHVEGIVDTVSSAVARSVELSRAVAIVALSESGFTPGMIARHKPIVPVLALTPMESTHRRLSLTYGVISHMIKPVEDMHAALRVAREELLRTKMARKGDTFILVCGMPFGNTGGTNTMVIQKID
jgi:pyruvate kinase